MLAVLAPVLAALPGGIDLAYGNAGPADVTFYANSPSGGACGTALRKFVDALPGLGPQNQNSRGQYIPIAVPDTTTFPGSDLYHIGIDQWSERFHADLRRQR